MRYLSESMASLAAQGATAQPAAAIDPRVSQAIDAWDATFDKGDAKALATFYLGDAFVLSPSHVVVKGTAAIQDFFTAQFANHVTGHVLVPFDVSAAGDTLIVSSTWAAHGQDGNGKPISFGGLATHVFRVQADQSLKLSLHIFN